MELSSAQANFVSVAMLVVPLLWMAWGLVSGRVWGMGLALLAGAALLLFMGSMVLAGRSFQSRTLYREGGRVAFVDRYEAALFNERREPVFLPEGSRASVQEGVGPRSKKYPHMRPSTIYRVSLGTDSQSHVMAASHDRAQAEARAAELDSFMKGEAPRLELPEAESGQGLMLFFGGTAYGLGLVLSVVGSGVLVRGAGTSPRPPRKRGGPRSGRSAGRGWKRR